MSFRCLLRCLSSGTGKPGQHLALKNYVRKPLNNELIWNRKNIARQSSSIKNIPPCVHRNGTMQHLKRNPLGARYMTAGVTSSIPEIKLEFESDGKVVEISWANDDFTSRYHSIWLRNNCQCVACKQNHSGQKTIEQHDIPMPCTVKAAEIKDGTHLQIWWKETDHEGVISLDFLRENSYSTESLQSLSSARDVTYFKGPIEKFNFQDISSCKDAFSRWLQCMDVYGIAIVTDVPSEQRQVIKVAELIAPVQHTLYGELFDVVTSDQPINAAYTSDFLNYHMDLMYYESCPGLQLLHCLRFDDTSEGGESIFLDVFHTVDEFRQLYPHHFDTLVRVPATFQKLHFERERPAAYMYQRPHITLNPEGKVTCVVWSPQFEGPLKVKEEDVEPYYEAYHTFASLLQNSSVQVEYRMRNGECVTFNNRRILHGRKAFTLKNKEQRHYEGCYVNIDDFRNKVQVAYIQNGSKYLVKRCGNQCWF